MAKSSEVTPKLLNSLKVISMIEFNLHTANSMTLVLVGFSCFFFGVLTSKPTILYLIGINFACDSKKFSKKKSDVKEPPPKSLFCANSTIRSNMNRKWNTWELKDICCRNAFIRKSSENLRFVIFFMVSWEKWVFLTYFFVLDTSIKKIKRFFAASPTK